MKKTTIPEKYVSPEAEIVTFSTDDILTTSAQNAGDNYLSDIFDDNWMDR